MTWIEAAYGALVEAARVMAPAVGALRPGLAETLAERRAAVAEIRRWAAESRRPELPLLWLHGASAGELLGALPAVDALRRRSPLQLLVTYFSPSGRAAVPALRPDYHGFPPFDTRREGLSALRAARPAAVVLAKGDVWPGLTRAAERDGVPLALVNGTVRPDSSRLRPVVRGFLRPAYGRLDRVGAASADDARRLRELGARADALRVTGDAAFDLAVARVDAAREEKDPVLGRLSSPPSGVIRLIAGSIWPEDEDVLFPALGSLGDRVQPVLVPHRPDEAAIARLRRRCRSELRVEPAVWSEGAGARRSAPLIVDVVGILAVLYLAGQVAYVGGGFGDAGLHSVVEPAAAGLPVTFGPGHSRREAADLLARGAAVELDAGNASAVLSALVEDAERRTRMGRAARAYAEEGAGAAEAGAELILDLWR